jgi:hypothetical protein
MRNSLGQSSLLRASAGRKMMRLAGGPHARKTLQFRKKRCNFQKARAGEVLYVCHQRIKRPLSLK